MDTVRCNLCGSSMFRALGKETGIMRLRHPGEDHISVLECLNCGLRFLSPRFRIKEGMYEEEYFKHYLEGSAAMTGGNFEIPEHLKRRLQIMEKYSGKKGKLLEIGIGTGLFLNHARSEGWEVYGLDISRWACEKAREKFGLDVICGSLEGSTFPENCFDAVHMNHVLEHVPDPLGTLKTIKAILKKGGVLFLEVPNEFGCLLDMIKINLLKKIPKEPTFHLYFFTQRTVKEMVKCAGLDAVFTRTARRDLDTGSRYFFGKPLKAAVYFFEILLGMQPNIELLALK